MNTPDSARHTAEHAARAIAARVDRPEALDAVDGLDLAQVKGRARTIRRRRRLATTGASLAAVAVVAPLTLWGAGHLAPSELQPADPAQRTHVTLATDAPRGDDPRTAWAAEGVVQVPGADPVDLLEEVDSVHRLGDGVAVTTNVGGRRVVRHEASDGTGFLRPVTQSVSVNAAGDLLAYVTPAGDVTVMDTETNATVLGRVGTSQSPVAVVGDAACAATGEGCSVLLDGEGLATPLRVTADQNAPLAPKGTVLRAASSELASFIVSRRGTPDVCTRVATLDTEETLWESCDVVVEAFSPDGRWGLAKDTDSDGLGSVRMMLLDARTGDVVVTADVAKRGDFIAEGTWEDDAHVLLSTYSAGQWYVHRVGVDGSHDQAIDPVAGPDVPPAVTTETLP